MSLAKRPFGRTGLRISEVSFGCGPTARLMIEGDVELQDRVVRRALDLGVDYFDTAASYGEGRSETQLGQTLRRLGAKPVVATKVTLEWADLGDIARAVTGSIEASLHRMGLQSLDVVHLHNRVGRSRAPRPVVGSGAQLEVRDVLGHGGVVEALEPLRDRGLVRAIGLCAFGGEGDAAAELIESDRFDSVLVNYSLLNRSAWSGSADDGVMNASGVALGEMAARRGMAVIALRVLEAGLLTGRPSQREAASARHPEGKATGRLEGLLTDGAASLEEAAIRFVLSNAAVTTALVGVSDIRHVENAVAAASLGPFPSDILRQLEAFGRPHVCAPAGVVVGKAQASLDTGRKTE